VAAAIDTFERLDARPWTDRAHAELAATGVTVRRRDPSTVDDLTPQELQIAVLLAGGKTTREAVTALFLSPKTIEYHYVTSTRSSPSTPERSSDGRSARASPRLRSLG
jgi:FixJ family two-component response regulator